jgi:pimeloyl-ACP methyl ester carboxylesterase
VERIENPVGQFTFDALAAGHDDGELVLLLHGFPETSYSWRNQLAALADAGYRAVAPDQRGYSPRARPADVAAYRVDHLVADVLAMADWVGGHRFHLVGHDWGAAVAWQVAGRYPERLRSLTALSTPHPKALTAAIRGELRSDQGERSGYMKTFSQQGSEDALLADDAAALRAVWSRLGDGAVEAYVAALGAKDALRAALNWYSAADRSLNDLGPIEVPTLYVWSTEDPALGREAAEATADHVSGPYRFEILDDVSHWIAEEVPDRLNAMLLEHLAATS